MALKKFNSIDGYTVGSTAVTVIDTNGNITTPVANIAALSGNLDGGGFNVSNVANVTVTIVKTTAVTFSQLPAAATAGAGSRAFVTDANTAVFGTDITGGASNAVPVYSDGTNWRVG